MNDILFLDDDQSRCALFRARVPSATIVHTAQEAILAMHRQPWDVVFLDHDLGGESYADPERDDTGGGVVRWIAQAQPNVAYFVVHTMNGTASLSMYRELVEAGYMVSAIGFEALCDPGGFEQFVENCGVPK